MLECKYLGFFIDACREHLFSFTQVEADVNQISRVQGRNQQVFISAVIGLVGEMEGSASLSLPKELALKIASQMLMEEVEEFSFEVRDAIGEFANIVIGTARNKLTDLSFGGEKITPPTSSVGEGHGVFYSPRVEITEVEFSSPQGVFFLTIGLKARRK